MLANYNTTNPLQDQVQQLLDEYDTNNNIFRLDIDKDLIRHSIGESFTEEPIMKWSMGHFDRSKVLKSQEELVHFCRFANSYALLKDLDAPLHFQLCELDSNTTDDNVIVSCASLQKCHPHPPRGPLWLRRIQSNWTMMVHTLKIMFGFGDSLPSAFHSSYMSRLQALTQNWIDNVDEWHYKYGPSRPHLTLNLVGVNPKYNGQGKGKIIMNEICKLADDLDQDIYLEAGGKLKGFYEKFGFVVKHVETLVDPDDASRKMDVHLMVREVSPATKSTLDSTEK